MNHIEQIQKAKVRAARRKRSSKPEKVLESVVETHLRNRIKALGGIAYKFTSPARRSVPDRLVLLPGGRIEFVECKATGEKPTPNQLGEHGMLRLLGFTVHVVDSKAQVDALYPLRVSGVPYQTDWVNEK